MSHRTEQVAIPQRRRGVASKALEHLPMQKNVEKLPSMAASVVFVWLHLHGGRCAHEQRFDGARTPLRVCLKLTIAAMGNSAFGDALNIPIAPNDRPRADHWAKSQQHKRRAGEDRATRSAKEGATDPRSPRVAPQ